MRALAIVVAGLTLLAACGTQSADSSTADDAAASPSPAASDSPTPAKDKTKKADKASPEVPDVLKWQARTISGEKFDATTLAGKPVVFWFWAPWCPTCIGQIPWVGALSDKHGDEVSFVGVGGLDSSDALPEFADKVTDSVIELSDPDGEVWRRFGITAQSTFVVLDAKGVELASGSVSQDELTRLVTDLAG